MNLMINNFLFYISPKKVGFFLVFIAIIFNAVFLWTELSISTFQVNDEVYHQFSAREASLALKKGFDPTDFFLSPLELGYPLFHHYQHFPQVVTAVVDQITGNFFPISRLFDFFRYLLLVFFPLSIFLAMRRFGFDYLAAGFSALISSLLSTDYLFGFDYKSYVWQGFGMYPQLWVMFFLPLALAEIYRVISQKQHFFLALFFSTIVLLSHLIYSYILLLSAVLFLFLQPKKDEIFLRLKRLAIFFLLLGIITSYFYIPLLLDLEYVGKSQWVPEWHWNSLGAKQVLSKLFTGQLFDFGRFPSLTILFFLSFVWLLVLKFYQKEHYRLLIILTVFWLFLFFGRATWGPLLNILPFSGSLPLHRFIGGFHLFAIMLVGAGTAKVWERLAEQKVAFKITFLVIFLALLSPVYLSQIKFYQANKEFRIENQKAFFEAGEELSDIEQTLKDLPPGRVYAGLPGTWGDYDYYKIGWVPFYAIFSQWGIDSFSYSYSSQPLNADLRLHFNDSRVAEYNLFNIRYVLLHKTWTSPDYYFPIKEFENYILYAVPTTGYFDLVDAPAVFYGQSSDFYFPNSEWLFSSLLELKQHPIIELGREPKKTFGLPVFPFRAVNEEILNNLAQPLAERGEILAERIELNKYWAQFRVNQESYLMLKVNYHPGWQVYLDYEKVSPVMLAPGFIGIKVPSGTHQAFFLYESPTLRFPLLIFGIFLLLIIFFSPKIPPIRKKLWRKFSA